MAKGLEGVDFTSAIAAELQKFIDVPTTENVTSNPQIKAAIADAIASKIGAKNIIELDLDLLLIGTKLSIGARLVANEIQIQIDQLNAEVEALQNSVTTLQTDLATAQGNMSNLQAAIDGLTIGQDVQAWSATLDAIAALTLQPDQLLGTNGSGAIALTPKKVEGYAKIEHRINASSAGGTPIGAKETWITVPLNQVSTASGYLAFVTISTGRITVPQGTYLVEGRVFGCGVVRFKSRLYNVTGSLELIKGESMGATHDTFVNDATYGSMSLSQVSVLKDRITLNQQSDIELQIICTDYHTYESSLGVKVWGSGAAEIAVQANSTENYSSLILEKVD